MSEYDVGDRVRIDIPDQTDPDHDRYHGEHGRIIDILEDEAGTLTGDKRDSTIYRIELSNGEELDLRHQSIRPVLSGYYSSCSQSIELPTFRLSIKPRSSIACNRV